ncbi:uncharacterized protein LOC136026270 [Artemia franciscana]|uniref:uncharacterized protein LOC136026270 n=1 Tax=Artemia franciscana TaxID=6661 RepID=UPI0032D9C8EE
MILRTCCSFVLLAIASAQQFQFDPNPRFEDFRQPASRLPQKPVRKQTTQLESAETSEEADINTIPGTPGESYPTFHSVPRTNFNCAGKVPGYYADVESRCQGWHYCDDTGHFESFLCPNGTIYDQAKRVCDWWFSVDCSLTEQFHEVNKDLYIIPERFQESEESFGSEEGTPIVRKKQKKVSRQRTENVPIFVPQF